MEATAEAAARVAATAEVTTARVAAAIGQSERRCRCWYRLCQCSAVASAGKQAVQGAAAEAAVETSKHVDDLARLSSDLSALSHEASSRRRWFRRDEARERRRERPRARVSVRRAGATASCGRCESRDGAGFATNCRRGGARASSSTRSSRASVDRALGGDAGGRATERAAASIAAAASTAAAASSSAAAASCLAAAACLAV